MQSPAWQYVMHGAKGTQSAGRGEDGFRTPGRVRVEANREVVLDVLLGYFVSGRAPHVVVFRYSVGVCSSKRFHEFVWLVLDQNSRTWSKSLRR